MLCNNWFEQNSQISLNCPIWAQLGRSGWHTVHQVLQVTSLCYLQTLKQYGMNLIYPNQDESGQGERNTSHLICWRSCFDFSLSTLFTAVDTRPANCHPFRVRFQNQASEWELGVIAPWWEKVRKLPQFQQTLFIIYITYNDIIMACC